MRRTVEDSLGLVGKERDVANYSESTRRMAQCMGRKGKGKRNVLEGRNDLALLLDVDTVLC